LGERKSYEHEHPSHDPGKKIGQQAGPAGADHPSDTAAEHRLDPDCHPGGKRRKCANDENVLQWLPSWAEFRSTFDKSLWICGDPYGLLILAVFKFDRKYKSRYAFARSNCSGGKNVDHFRFWYRWLMAVSILLIFFGVFMAIFNPTPFFDLFNSQIDPVFWGESPLPPSTASFQAWVYGVLGATVAGWGICMAFIVYYPYRRRERWAWWALTVGIAVWYLIDTSISLAHGVVFNAAFNTLLLLLAGIPLLATRTAMNTN
jgi:hypothetical protein